MRRQRALAVALVLASCVVTLPAQQPASQTQRPPVFRSDTNLIQVDAYPMKDGRVMTNLEKGDLEAADVTLTNAAKGPNPTREVFYNLGEVKFAKGETDEAVKYYERASQMDTNWGKPIFKLGLAKLQKADTAGAIELMNKVIAADPNSAEAAQAKALIEQLKKG